jgi:outer membrane protein OmpA-like peptidoglycan-associated protein
MLRVLVLACALLSPSVAAAEPTQLGVWFGPRIFNGDSGLGYIDDAPAHATLHNGIELGARASGQFFPFEWLIPEFEIAFSPTSTTEACTPAGLCAASTNVFWLEPRVQLRFEILPRRPIQPFIVVGGGTPVAFSSARMTYNSGVAADGYAGAGVRFDTHKGFAFRFDARVSILQGVNHFLAPELDVGFGIELLFGRKKLGMTSEENTGVSAIADKDGDGIPDAQDKCPDRPEDNDGFEDSDGCPDIDNDLDRVLDLADKCVETPETYNGFQDDDGCPDTVPPEVEALKGTIEGLFYAETETVVRDSAQASLGKLAKVLIANPSVKIVLVGHTDDREAKAFITEVEGQPPADLDTISTDLARARAEAVRQALVAAGVPQGRIVVDGVGAEEPVSDNNTNKGRLANRRVELKLFVAPH